MFECSKRWTSAVDVHFCTVVHILRGTIVNGTYGIHKNLYISSFLLTLFGPLNYGPP